MTTAQPVQGETPLRIGALAFAWVLLVCLAVAMQSVVPPFGDVFSSFGADLPLPTVIAMQVYPLLLTLPLLVALVWNFWPRKPTRLRAAAIVCWSGLGLIVLMMGSLYLPIVRLGTVV